MYTTSQITQLTGFNRSRLWKFRNGHKMKKYFYDKILYENTHWHWERGKIFYTEKGLQILLKRKSELLE